MQTRLLTTPSEAKVLRDAGYPQDIGDGEMFHLCCTEDAPEGHDHEKAYGPRLDELLAFLETRAPYVLVHSELCKVPAHDPDCRLRCVEVYESNDGSDGAPPEFHSHETLTAAAVEAVLHVLNSAPLT